jgi:cathepsin L
LFIQDAECRFSKENVGATVSGIRQVITFSEDALQAAVAIEGPISVGMDASRTSFQLYK